MNARWNVSAGHFFFRYRNAILPGLIVLVVVSMQPRIMFGNPPLDQALILIGALVALSGEVVRLATIGFDYIDRGGRNKQVYALDSGYFNHPASRLMTGVEMMAKCLHPEMRDIQVPSDAVKRLVV